MVRRMFATLVLVIGSFALAAPSASAEQIPMQSTKKSAPAITTPINLNSASSAELEALPGVGPAMAARILEFRQKNGGFKKVEDLMHVKGIGEKVFLKLKSLVTIAPPRVVER